MLEMLETWNINRGKLPAVSRPAQERGHMGHNWQGHRGGTGQDLWNSHFSSKGLHVSDAGCETAQLNFRPAGFWSCFCSFLFYYSLL